jgi:hypothetical protein
MRRPSRPGLSLVVALCANIPLAAQNLESIGKEKPFSFAGGLSFNQIFYSSSGIASRRAPYSYFASGNLNLSLYGWSIPLSFTRSNQQTSFSQPFNQYSLHPTWKWITAHAGYTSMSFSPYTVNGHIFLGCGVDIAPAGNWRLSALYGRFLKAVEADTAHAPITLPAFERRGYALKATYGNGRNFVDIILFHAKDVSNSIGKIPDSLGVTPQQNLVLSVGGGKTIFKHFQLKAELATSALTRDTRSEKTTHRHLLARSGIFFEPRISSAYYNALKTSFQYQQDAWIIGVAYERIDPGYRTLGAYYFNNDLENITLNGSAGILKGKMNIATSTGIQHDNLDKTKVSSMRRLVGSVSLNYIPSQRLNLSSSYSSFQTFTNIRSEFETINQLTPYDHLDTLNFTQISRSASLSGIYTFRGSENKKQHVNVHLTWQDAAEKQGHVEQHSGSRFYNLNVGYSMVLVPQNTSLALAFNTAITQGYTIQTRIIGPGASVTRSFLNRKFRTTLSSSYNKTRSSGVNVHAVINCRLNSTFSIKDKHNISLSAVMVKRINATEGAGGRITELTATAGYNYSFGGNHK